MGKGKAIGDGGVSIIWTRTFVDKLINMSINNKYCATSF